MTTTEIDLLDEDTFSWDNYLEKTSSEAAPATCFCQQATPPKNEFQLDNKLETFDPRNTTSTCIGSVKEVSGSRIRLRLDGTDDRNDFWLMVDSDHIHPYGFTAKQNRKIQPPLGYGNDISKWPRFLDKIITTATANNAFAKEECFKPTPAKPIKNEFKVGHKLEAVDPKNPHLICPATIKEIKRDKLLITFDGWSHSSDFWCSFASRDLFPIGFCSKSGHILQYPGNLYDKKIINTSTVLKTSPIVSKPKKSISKPSPENKKNKNESLDNSLLNVTDTIPNENEPNGFDLSLVKVEAVEPDETSHLKDVNLNIDIKQLIKPRQPVNAIVYIIPNGNCGRYVKTEKFHSSHTKFGPGSPSSVYKSILQSLIDCAYNRLEVFNLIPSGKSQDYVRLKNSNINERKTLTQIENSTEMWSNIKQVCSILEINDSQLLSKTKITPPKKQPTNEQTKHSKTDLEQAPSSLNLPLTPQPSSSSSASSSSSLSENQNINTELVETQSKSVSVKRRSTTASNNLNDEQINLNDLNTPCKVFKLDKSLASVQVSDWSVDQVVFYIYQLNDSNFSSYVEMFRHHEIDGKALLLLTTDILMKYMGFKLGPALKMNNCIEKLRKNLMTSLLNYNQVTPKVECTY